MDKLQTRHNRENYKISEFEIREYVLKQFQEIKKSNEIKNMVSFQASNKFMLMAHDQIELKNMGRIIASYSIGQFAEIVEEYERHLRIAMEKVPTSKTHTNVIMHIFGYFSKKTNAKEKEFLFTKLAEFREEKITIGTLLLKITPIIFRFNNTYLASQSYFLLYADVEKDSWF